MLTGSWSSSFPMSRWPVHPQGAAGGGCCCCRCTLSPDGWPEGLPSHRSASLISHLFPSLFKMYFRVEFELMVYLRQKGMYYVFGGLCSFHILGAISQRLANGGPFFPEDCLRMCLLWAHVVKECCWWLFQIRVIFRFSFTFFPEVKIEH